MGPVKFRLNRAGFHKPTQVYTPSFLNDDKLIETIPIGSQGIDQEDYIFGYRFVSVPALAGGRRTPVVPPAVA